ncbi:Tex family protein [Shouchella clausii]|uniref:RNA-binding transcriptional accessory protein n=1 Tax=Shouchella clausii TaxID=79880 RepID=A0A268RUF3_SHOCL|nr:Tex family protein [Shouchella clausii]AST94864.1 RNA-binding transcriptional accessory protein [Shouchella clausii]MCM3550788.1 RNA-binding transcriptional accessory protein [Shouchella clausii]MCR1290024.1 RNA-binding transcriptional accessory protein [Shouchella clausii]MEB5473367.1 Tex family protein [Shouchella clausii]PAF23852.1 RNA-binding transcriptional accessory protein [Shouchella clausii]
MEELVNETVTETGLAPKQVRQVVELLKEGNTVPFIARYRKEQTGGLDELQIKAIADAHEYAENVMQRREEVLRLIDEQGKLTAELKAQIKAARKLQTLEDLYRPYKQKRRTRATAAKEKGLEPLAQEIMSFPREFPLETATTPFINQELGVPDSETAIAGAKDILAEMFAEDPEVRSRLRERALKQATVETSRKNGGAEDEKSVYALYYDFQEPIKKMVPHRTLAVNRGEREEVLRVHVRFPSDAFIDQIKRLIIKKHGSPVVPIVEEAIEDAYKRLVEPSLEREVRAFLTEKAEEQAITIFAENVKQLLLQPPMKGKVVLGIDPAFRTGCKWAVVDATGKALEVGVMYPTAPHHKTEEAAAIIRNVTTKYGVKMIAIGNGTASRETEQFVASTIKEIDDTLYYCIVNEAGASVYSASEIARAEFPDLQVEQRSAISIARRLQDPLAELVKIDPKSVGVGQYQHDVSQKKLNESLAFVVETAVNRVGVNVNTASAALLSYVAGLNKTQATNIVAYRDEHGPFTTRTALKSVPRLGAKTYEQCIGFLRVPDGKNRLDATAIHPESYNEAKKLLQYVEAEQKDIGTDKLKQRLNSLNQGELAETLDIGTLTLADIIDALARPNRDPRDELAAPQLKQDVLKMEDLEEGMELQGTVRNIVDFGAFVDIGVKQDGLVHVSKLADRYIKHPMEVVSIGDVVTVWVEGVDEKKGRISLTMKAPVVV